MLTVHVQLANKMGLKTILPSSLLSDRELLRPYPCIWLHCGSRLLHQASSALTVPFVPNCVSHRPTNNKREYSQGKVR
jgi:hypothetical protein